MSDTDLLNKRILDEFGSASFDDTTVTIALPKYAFLSMQRVCKTLNLDFDRYMETALALGSLNLLKEFNETGHLDIG